MADKSLKDALSAINKQFGAGSVIVMGDQPIIDVDVIPTGLFTLDEALGCGGIPKGRITEIYGAEASSKTTLALHLASEAQKASDVVAFVDVEHALDPYYAEKLGVDIDALLLSQPSSAEETMEIVQALVKSGHVGLIIIDSVAALVPKAELEGDFGDSHMGLVARLMSQSMRKLTAIIAKANVAVVFLNQTRSKIGNVYGSPITTTGGAALKFYSSIRIETAGFGKITAPGGTDIIGKNIRFKVVKNKLAAPFKVVECPLIYGEGISKLDMLLQVAVDKDIVKKAGSWYSYNNKKIGQGAEKVKIFLRENEKILKEIRVQLLTKNLKGDRIYPVARG